MIYFDSAANEVVIKMTGADADNFRCNTRDQLSDSEISEMTGLFPSFSDYLDADGVLNLIRSDDAELYKVGLDSALSEALIMLKDAKEREGRGTKETHSTSGWGSFRMAPAPCHLGHELNRP